jgi:hypothetical protein
MCMASCKKTYKCVTRQQRMGEKSRLSTWPDVNVLTTRKCFTVRLERGHMYHQPFSAYCCTQRCMFTYGFKRVQHHLAEVLQSAMLRTSAKFHDFPLCINLPVYLLHIVCNKRYTDGNRTKLHIKMSPITKLRCRRSSSGVTQSSLRILSLFII